MVEFVVRLLEKRYIYGINGDFSQKDIICENPLYRSISIKRFFLRDDETRYENSGCGHKDSHALQCAAA